MKFSINRNSLAAELGSLQSIVEKKSTIPILSNILIESAEGNEIRITGTDLDVTYVSVLAAKIDAPGAICIPARKLGDIVRQLPAGSELHFSQEPNFWTNLKCEKSNFRIAGMMRDNFPETLIPPTAALEVPASVLSSFIQHTAFAITTEQSRFTLSGAKLVTNGSCLRMISTDGHRLAFIEHKLTDFVDGKTKCVDLLIPKKALMEIARAIKLADPEFVSISEDLNLIYCAMGKRLVVCRKLSGTFPNYEMVIPKDNDKRIEFSAEDLKRAVARVSLMADARTESVKLSFTPNAITIRAQSSEEGEAEETITASYAGEEMHLGYNARYLIDFLNLMSGEGFDKDKAEKAAQTASERTAEPQQHRAALSFKDSNAQTVLTYENQKGFLCVVMPLRF